MASNNSNALAVVKSTQTIIAPATVSPSQADVDAASLRAIRASAQRLAYSGVVSALLPAIITERKSTIPVAKAQAACMADSAALAKAALAPDDTSERRKARAVLNRGQGYIAPKAAVTLFLAGLTDAEIGE